MKLPVRLITAVTLLFVMVVALGYAVNAGWFHEFDMAMSNTLNLREGQSPEWLISAAWWISWVGGGVQRYVIVTLLVVALWRWWGWGAAIAMGLTSLVSAFTSEAMKAYFARPRPDLVPHLDLQTSMAYPSGHANNAAVVYILFIMLVPQARHPGWQIAAALAIFVTGLSRVMLGVHWPTYVIGGWMLGTSFALFAAATIAWRRHQTETAFPSVLAPENDLPEN